MTASGPAVDEYPSLLWVIIPPALLISAYFTRKWYLARRLRVHGIGKGAPGFQTNVRRIRVTPEIAARLRRGEEVSPEEIAAASAKAEQDERDRVSPSIPAPTETSSSVSQASTPPEPVNEWLPSSINTPKKRAKGKRK
ncbi:hypothetical protein D9757_000402 [Collybiopsis confluens]|uniref:Uncharacterized protein n=1 Tax=Collybiopsis confluens TaxID=2823264 RepID=A0A8H5MGX8_9AGAR|nr:hypothetical protein D9757_000402 [Collybiopsis confluens]